MQHSRRTGWMGSAIRPRATTARPGAATGAVVAATRDSDASGRAHRPSMLVLVPLSGTALGTGMPTSGKKLLVVGASGGTGMRAIRGLLDVGYEPEQLRILTRDPSKPTLAPLRERGFDLVAAVPPHSDRHACAPPPFRSPIGVCFVVAAPPLRRTSMIRRRCPTSAPHARDATCTALQATRSSSTRARSLARATLPRRSVA